LATDDLGRTCAGEPERLRVVAVADHVRLVLRSVVIVHGDGDVDREPARLEPNCAGGADEALQQSRK
jgi:hypothetical protein